MARGGEGWREEAELSGAGSVNVDFPNSHDLMRRELIVNSYHMFAHGLLDLLALTRLFRQPGIGTRNIMLGAMSSIPHPFCSVQCHCMVILERHHNLLLLQLSLFRL